MKRSSKDRLEDLAISTIIKHWATIILLVAVVALMIYGTVVLYLNAAKFGAQTAISSYKSSKAESSEQAYQSTYESSFSTSEAKWHLSNKETIVFGGLLSAEKLEVLAVSDVEYIVNEGSLGKSISWLLVPGKGIFTVDLQKSDFVFDNDRNYVHVRIPKPELTECSIDSANVQQLFFKDGILDRSIGAGVELAMTQRQEAAARIQEEFLSNTSYYQSAKIAAETLVANLIKELNLDIPDLIVEVEVLE